MQSLLADNRLFEIEGEPLPAPVRPPAGVNKTFRNYDRHQSVLLPPSLDDWLPDAHTARFVGEVVDGLDRSAIDDSYESASGPPPYDPRLMRTADGSFHYCFNAQTVVDESHQVILATTLVTDATDINQLIPMIEATNTELAAAGITERPRRLLADADYCSKDNLEESAATGHDVLIATGRMNHHERVTSPKGRVPNDATSRQLMARRLRTTTGRGDYARRKAIVEPVFGQMKIRQRAGLLRLRSLEAARGEWLLHALCHNLRKLANANNAAMTG